MQQRLIQHRLQKHTEVIMTIPNLAEMSWRHHGLGMLQAEIDERHRVHIWHPKLARMDRNDFRSVHDHRFNLSSIILHGSLWDVRYEVRPEAPGDVVGRRTQMWGVRHAKIQTGDDVDLLGWVVANITSAKRYKAGQIYTVPRREFHTTRPEGLTITHVTRRLFDVERARVLGTRGGTAIVEKDIDHNRYADILGPAQEILDGLQGRS